MADEKPRENIFLPRGAQEYYRGPLDKPYQGTPAELYNMYRYGWKLPNPPPVGPMDPSQAWERTRKHLETVPSLYPRGGTLPNPDWNIKQHEDWLKKTPMSDLGTLVNLLKSG